MSPVYYRRGRNWYTAMGTLFIVSGAIVLVRQIILWSPGFVQDFLLSPELTNEKVSVSIIAFGSFMIAMVFRKKYDQTG